MQSSPSVPGAELVVDWWGAWISFHEFYLLATPKAGEHQGELRIHGWVTERETDERGYFKTSHDCIVRIRLAGIRSVVLSSRVLPAIIFGLEIEASAHGWDGHLGLVLRVRGQD